MIDPRELRIGNLVSDGYLTDKNNVRHHIALQIKSGYDIDAFKYSEPIPITEEWLIKLGFNKDNGFYSKGVLELSRKNDGIDGRQRYLLISNEFTPPLDYIHQLQNLYFVLTGQELELK